jgi:transcriptional regulator with XRE-family HTH domain
MPDWEQWPYSEIKIRDALRRLRELLGLTQEQLARSMGVTVRSVARWETQAESLPLEVLVRLRHKAIELGDEALFEYFERMVRSATSDDDEADLAVAVHDMTPGNLKEIKLVVELLRRVREDDPEVQPVVQEIEKLIQKTQILLAEQFRARKAAAKQPPGPTAKERILAAAKKTQKEQEHE